MSVSDKKPAPTHRGLGSIYRRRIKEPDGIERELPVWHVQFSVNGKQYRESTHTDSYNEAQKFLKRRIAEVTTGKFHGTAMDRTSMSDLLKDVIADYELKDRHSLNKMARPLIENRLMPYFGRRRATTVTVPTITAYVRQRKQDGAAVASINRELALLRRSSNSAVLTARSAPLTYRTLPICSKRKRTRGKGYGSMANTMLSATLCQWTSVPYSSLDTGRDAGSMKSLSLSGIKWT